MDNVPCERNKCTCAKPMVPAPTQMYQNIGLMVSYPLPTLSMVHYPIQQMAPILTVNPIPTMTMVPIYMNGQVPINIVPMNGVSNDCAECNKKNVVCNDQDPTPKSISNSQRAKDRKKISPVTQKHAKKKGRTEHSLVLAKNKCESRQDQTPNQQMEEEYCICSSSSNECCDQCIRIRSPSKPPDSTNRSRSASKSLTRQISEQPIKTKTRSWSTITKRRSKYSLGEESIGSANMPLTCNVDGEKNNSEKKEKKRRASSKHRNSVTSERVERVSERSTLQNNSQNERNRRISRNSTCSIQNPAMRSETVTTQRTRRISEQPTTTDKSSTKRTSKPSDNIKQSRRTSNASSDKSTMTYKSSGKRTSKASARGTLNMPQQDQKPNKQMQEDSSPDETTQGYDQCIRTQTPSKPPDSTNQFPRASQSSTRRASEQSIISGYIDYRNATERLVEPISRYSFKEQSFVYQSSTEILEEPRNSKLETIIRYPYKQRDSVAKETFKKVSEQLSKTFKDRRNSSKEKSIQSPVDSPSEKNKRTSKKRDSVAKELFQRVSEQLSKAYNPLIPDDHCQSVCSQLDEKMDRNSENSEPETETTQRNLRISKQPFIANRSSTPIVDHEDQPTLAISKSSIRIVDSRTTYFLKHESFSDMPSTYNAGYQNDNSEKNEIIQRISQQSETVDDIYGIENPSQKLISSNNQRILNNENLNSEQPTMTLPLNDEQSTMPLPLNDEQPTKPLPLNEEQPTMPLPFNDKQPAMPLPLNDEQPSMPLTFNDEQPSMPLPLNDEQPTMPLYTPTDAMPIINAKKDCQDDCQGGCRNECPSDIDCEVDGCVKGESSEIISQNSTAINMPDSEIDNTERNEIIRRISQQLENDNIEKNEIIQRISQQLENDNTEKNEIIRRISQQLENDNTEKNEIIRRISQHSEIIDTLKRTSLESVTASFDQNTIISYDSFLNDEPSILSNLQIPNQDTLDRPSQQDMQILQEVSTLENASSFEQYPIVMSRKESNVEYITSPEVSEYSEVDSVISGLPVSIDQMDVISQSKRASKISILHFEERTVDDSPEHSYTSTINETVWKLKRSSSRSKKIILEPITEHKEVEMKSESKEEEISPLSKSTHSSIESNIKENNIEDLEEMPIEEAVSESAKEHEMPKRKQNRKSVEKKIPSKKIEYFINMSQTNRKYPCQKYIKQNIYCNPCCQCQGCGVFPAMGCCLKCNYNYCSCKRHCCGYYCY